LDDQVFISQHIGDLATEPANHAFRRVIADLGTLYDATPDVIVSDLHPDYLSTNHADALSEGAGEPRSSTRGAQRIRVQHHVAHVLSCLAENELEPPVLGVAWDGTGLGTDGTIWGGEFFLVTKDQVERVAHLRPFRLPGGDAAAREPRRAALGLLHEAAIHNDKLLLHMQQTLGKSFTVNDLKLLHLALQRHVNSPLTSSVGRLFDALASLVGLRQQMHYEGQAAMELEFATAGVITDAAYTFTISDGPSPQQLDWAPMIEGILSDVAACEPVGLISAKFHNTLAEAIVAVARRVGEQRVALSGGCFQNRYLTERAVNLLRVAGFHPYWHQRVPTNDGGIALGQIIAARRAASIATPKIVRARQPVDRSPINSHPLREAARKEQSSCV
jgi:hydrogenase maturation protein HypF